jgi:GH24 family phage-related lysozyme (muramidase)
MISKIMKLRKMNIFLMIACMIILFSSNMIQSFFLIRISYAMVIIGNANMINSHFKKKDNYHDVILQTNQFSSLRFIDCIHKSLINFAMNECTAAAPPAATSNTPKTCNPPGMGTKVSKMHVSDRAMPMLEKLEGWNGIANNHYTKDKYGLYNDQAGLCTIGFGHLITSKTYPKGKPCDQQDVQDYLRDHPNGQDQSTAEAQLKVDIQTKEKELSNALGPNVELTQQQYDALILLAFNAGANGVVGKNKHLGNDIRAGNCDHTQIANDFRAINKIKVNGVLQESPELTNRRESEAAIFNFGIYPRI